jgi:galactokinase
VLEENQRVLDTCDAFRREDIAAISHLMAGSHRSMKELFEITTPEINLLVEIIDGVIGERGGVRMTGGGFGGCVVALLPEALVEEVIGVVAGTYEKKTGLRETIYRTRPADGVSLVF